MQWHVGLWPPYEIEYWTIYGIVLFWHDVMDLDVFLAMVRPSEWWGFIFQTTLMRSNQIWDLVVFLQMWEYRLPFTVRYVSWSRTSPGLIHNSSRLFFWWPHIIGGDGERRVERGGVMAGSMVTFKNNLCWIALIWSLGSEIGGQRTWKVFQIWNEIK